MQRTFNISFSAMTATVAPGRTDRGSCRVAGTCGEGEEEGEESTRKRSELGGEGEEACMRPYVGV